MFGTNGICNNCELGKWQDNTGQTSCNDCPINKGAGPESDRTSLSSCGDCTAPEVSKAGEVCYDPQCEHGFNPDPNVWRCDNDEYCGQARLNYDNWAARYESLKGWRYGSFNREQARWQRDSWKKWIDENC